MSRLSADDIQSNFSSSMHAASMTTVFHERMFNRSPSRSRQIGDSMEITSSSRQIADNNDRIETGDNEFSMPQMWRNLR